MRPTNGQEPHGSDLHTLARGAADALLQPHAAGAVPEDLRTVVGYYLSCVGAADRAALQLLAYAGGISRKGAR